LEEHEQVSEVDVVELLWLRHGDSWGTLEAVVRGLVQTQQIEKSTCMLH
jgi:hypothetical protein